MRGSDFERPRAEHIDVLKRASSASITTMLRQRGINKVGIPPKPVLPQFNRVVGPAVTLRSVPGREDRCVRRDMRSCNPTESLPGVTSR